MQHNYTIEFQYGKSKYLDALARDILPEQAYMQSCFDSFGFVKKDSSCECNSFEGWVVIRTLPAADDKATNTEDQQRMSTRTCYKSFTQLKYECKWNGKPILKTLLL